ncbi:Acrosin-binding protein [Bienertia sinuspersici]
MPLYSLSKMAIGSALSTLESARFIGLRVSNGDDVMHLPKNRLLPQEMGTSQRIFHCSGVSMESSSYANTIKNFVV